MFDTTRTDKMEGTVSRYSVTFIKLLHGTINVNRFMISMHISPIFQSLYKIKKEKLHITIDLKIKEGGIINVFLSILAGILKQKTD